MASGTDLDLHGCADHDLQGGDDLGLYGGPDLRWVVLTMTFRVVLTLVKEPNLTDMVVCF